MYYILSANADYQKKLMESFEKLQQRIQNYHEEHGLYPQVKVSEKFWEKYAYEIAELAGKGIDIRVIGNLWQEESFIIENPQHQNHETINTVFDLWKQAGKLIAEGKGEWPVRFQPHDARVYLRVKLCPIVPGKAPSEGLELFPDFAGAPEGEHVLVLFGEDDDSD
ncbi:MAG: hypothetical protein PVI44_14975 [Balneolaceae bacterium]